MVDWFAVGLGLSVGWWASWFVVLLLVDRSGCYLVSLFSVWCFTVVGLLTVCVLGAYCLLACCCVG